jgi:putative toxin-antitoxin system antitoxin component (TIGR02293 family)
MKREKKITPNYPAPTTEPTTVEEPIITYTNTAMRTIGMMGMIGKKDYGTIKNENDLIDVIRTGVPRRVMDNLMTITDISMTEMAAIIHTSDRTLRRYTPSQKLSQEQSERMVELARLYTRGEEVFGSIPEFRQWMNTQLVTFGNKKPKDYLDTSLGIAMITDELGRIQNGIFA